MIIMNRISIFVISILVVFSVHAQYAPSNMPRSQAPALTTPPLRVAIGRFSPPFEIETSNNMLYGFDVTMMEYLCKRMQRPCQFIPLRFTQLLTAVENNEADVAVGAITITVERSQRVNFSMAYFPSHSRFIGSVKLVSEPFSLSILNEREIGVELGSVFTKQIQEMGIKDPKIIPFDSEDGLIEALSSGEVELALMDAPTAKYWANHTGGVLKIIGPEFPFGFGYGIALNKNNIQLLQDINAGITEFQKSKAFHEAFRMYFEEF
jgi:polar amino acid transport system substrate-binding protein